MPSVILGVERAVLERMSNILHAIATPYEINVPKFREYAWRTAESLVTMYPWKKMTPTVHKILVHGADIIAAAPLPIGFFTEEAQESRNKDVSTYRLNFTRKTNREDCMADTLHMLLQTSDPVINSHRTARTKKVGSLSSGVLNLLKIPHLQSVAINEEG